MRRPDRGPQPRPHPGALQRSGGLVERPPRARQVADRPAGVADERQCVGHVGRGVRAAGARPRPAPAGRRRRRRRVGAARAGPRSRGRWPPSAARRSPASPPGSRRRAWPPGRGRRCATRGRWPPGPGRPPARTHPRRPRLAAAPSRPGRAWPRSARTRTGRGWRRPRGGPGARLEVVGVGEQLVGPCQRLGAGRRVDPAQHEVLEQHGGPLDVALVEQARAAPSGSSAARPRTGPSPRPGPDPRASASSSAASATAPLGQAPVGGAPSVGAEPGGGVGPHRLEQAPAVAAAALVLHHERGVGQPAEGGPRPRPRRRRRRRPRPGVERPGKTLSAGYSRRASGPSRSTAASRAAPSDRPRRRRAARRRARATCRRRAGERGRRAIRCGRPPPRPRWRAAARRAPGTIARHVRQSPSPTATPWSSSRRTSSAPAGDVGGTRRGRRAGGGGASGCRVTTASPAIPSGPGPVASRRMRGEARSRATASRGGLASALLAPVEHDQRVAPRQRARPPGRARRRASMAGAPTAAASAVGNPVGARRGQVDHDHPVGEVGRRPRRPRRPPAPSSPRRPGPTMLTTRWPAEPLGDAARSSSRPTSVSAAPGGCRARAATGRRRGDGSWRRMAVSSRRSSWPGSSPVRSARTAAACRYARRASVWRPARVSAVISSAQRRSRSGSSFTRRPRRASARSTSPAASQGVGERLLDRPALVVEHGRVGGRARGRRRRRSDSAGPRQAASGLGEGGHGRRRARPRRASRPPRPGRRPTGPGRRRRRRGRPAAQDVAVGDRVDAHGPVAAQRPPQAGHVALQGRPGRGGCAVGPQARGQVVDGQRAARVQRQEREQVGGVPSQDAGLVVGVPHARRAQQAHDQPVRHEHHRTCTGQRPVAVRTDVPALDRRPLPPGLGGRRSRRPGASSTRWSPTPPASRGGAAGHGRHRPGPVGRRSGRRRPPPGRGVGHRRAPPARRPRGARRPRRPAGRARRRGGGGVRARLPLRALAPRRAAPGVRRADRPRPRARPGAGDPHPRGVGRHVRDPRRRGGAAADRVPLLHRRPRRGRGAASSGAATCRSRAS